VKRLRQFFKANELFIQAWVLGSTIVAVVFFRAFSESMNNAAAATWAIFWAIPTVGTILLGLSVLARRLRAAWGLWRGEDGT
jgi:uncharacterized membrane protein YhaH (DUF805 family)